MNVPIELNLHDAIGSNENKVRVVCKTHKNVFNWLKNKFFPKASVGALTHGLNC